LLKPVLDINETAIFQVEKRGYGAEDVRHILLTHLDLDHAGGLRDFPNATVHVLDTELETATNPPTVKDRMRFPKAQREGVTFQTHKAEGEDWFGFEAVKNIAGLPEDILMVPLIGHTRGHTGIAVKSGDGWLLHAGDAYFYRGEIETPPSNIFALKLTAKQTETIREQRLSNVERLRELKASGEAEVFCAHDPVELARLA
jgi:glyoxylase-like metal-dependent hydrolase (beta-lactamase superfamily II)